MFEQRPEDEWMFTWESSICEGPETQAFDTMKEQRKGQYRCSSESEGWWEMRPGMWARPDHQGLMMRMRPEVFCLEQRVPLKV